MTTTRYFRSMLSMLMFKIEPNGRAFARAYGGVWIPLHVSIEGLAHRAEEISAEEAEP
jgi:hypothetical protein